MSKGAMKLVETWRSLHPSERSIAKTLAYKSFSTEAPFAVVMSLTDIQAATELARGSVARTLNAFEAAGWIRRKRVRQPGLGNVTSTIELLKESRFQELTDNHRKVRDPSLMVRLPSPTMRLGWSPGGTSLVSSGDQLYKEGESLRRVTTSSKTLSSSTPSLDRKIRPDDNGPDHKPPALDPGTATVDVYVAEVRALCQKIPGTRKSFHQGDVRLAAKWCAAKVPLLVVEDALLLGALRRLGSSGDPPITRINSLAYFIAVVDEVMAAPMISPGNRELLRLKVEDAYHQRIAGKQQERLARALDKIRIRLDNQLDFHFWDQVSVKERAGVVTISAAADYKPEQHGSLELLRECLVESGVAVREVVFEKNARAP